MGKAEILFLLLIAVFLVYLQLLHFSAANVKVIVEEVRFPDLTDTLSLAATRRLRVGLGLTIEGKGPLPVVLRSYAFDVFVESAYVGMVTSNQAVEVKPGETRILREVFTINAVQVSTYDLMWVAQAVREYGSVLAELDGYVEIDVLFYTVRIPVRYHARVELG